MLEENLENMPMTTAKKETTNNNRENQSELKSIVNKGTLTKSNKVTKSETSGEKGSNNKKEGNFLSKLDYLNKSPIHKLNSMKNLFNKSVNNHKPKHGIHQQKIIVAMDKLSVNKDVIENFKNLHSNDKKEWNDVTKMSVNLKEVAKLLDATTNPKTRKTLTDIMSSFEVQHKKLLKENAVKKAKSHKAEKPSDKPKQSPEASYVLNEDGELVKENEVSDEESQMCGISAETKDKDKDEVKFVGEKQTTDECKSPKRKQPTSTENLNGSPSKLPRTGNIIDLSASIKGTVWETPSKAHPKPSSESNSKERKEALKKSVKSIRVRMQFTAEGGKEVKFQEQLRQVIYDTMQCVKAVDPAAALYPWKNGSSLKAINGNEAKLLSKEVLTNYIDIPVKIENKFIAGKTYYRNGLHIKTECDVNTFVDIWSNKKYDKDPKSPFTKWKSIKAAEMQRFDRGYSVGYFVGTVERGEYSTIEKQLQDEYGEAVEISFQMIEQKGVSAKVWQVARELAEKKFENPYSKEFKRQKFMNSPSGLVVFVGKQSLVKSVRRKMCQKYSKLEKNQWPVMRDGSRMRFIPLLPGLVKNKEIYKNLYEHLLTQSISKANDIKFDLNLWDILSPKEYLGNKSLETILHGVTSEKYKGLPLFKHICRKWQRDPSRENWEVVVSPMMEQEACAYLRKMRFTLKKKYKEGMRNHYFDPAKKANYEPKYYVPTNEFGSEDYDEEIENLVLKMGNADPYTKVLIEGMDLMENKSNTIDESMLINTPSDEEKQEPTENTSSVNNKSMNNSTQQNQEQQEGETSISIEEDIEQDADPNKILQEENQHTETNLTTWEEMTLAEEVEELIHATPQEIKKIKGSISSHNITSLEIQTWKNMNWNEYESILKKVGRKEYEVMRLIVQSILDERRINEEMISEQTVLANLIGFSNENEKSSNLKALEPIIEGSESEEKGVDKEIIDQDDDPTEDELYE